MTGGKHDAAKASRAPSASHFSLRTLSTTAFPPLTMLMLLLLERTAVTQVNGLGRGPKPTFESRVSSVVVRMRLPFAKAFVGAWLGIYTYYASCCTSFPQQPMLLTQGAAQKQSVHD